MIKKLEDKHDFMMIDGLPESVGNEEVSVFEKEIWNAAIEAAAKVCDINSEENVRKLKK